MAVKVGYFQMPCSERLKDRVLFPGRVSAFLLPRRTKHVLSELETLGLVSFPICCLLFDEWKQPPPFEAGQVRRWQRDAGANLLGPIAQALQGQRGGGGGSELGPRKLGALSAPGLGASTRARPSTDRILKVKREE